MKHIKISAVSYNNTLPFLYGLENNAFLQENTIITTDYPALCAQKLIEDKTDIGLIPIAAIPQLDNYMIISDFCIASERQVESVLLVSDVELSEINTVILDYQSMTSVRLTRILAKYYWHISPEWENGNTDYLTQIKHHTAGVIIGDRALTKRHNYKYTYDLAEEWYKFTDLPFVFAMWVSNKKISDKIIEELNKSFEFGTQNIDKTLHFFKNKIRNSNYDMNKYLTQNISFKLNKKKKKAIDTFLFFLSKI